MASSAKLIVIAAALAGAVLVAGSVSANDIESGSPHHAGLGMRGGMGMHAGMGMRMGMAGGPRCPAPSWSACYDNCIKLSGTARSDMMHCSNVCTNRGCQ